MTAATAVQDGRKRTGNRLTAANFALPHGGIGAQF
jgi:hypothetical protein